MIFAAIAESVTTVTVQGEPPSVTGADLLKAIIGLGVTVLGVLSLIVIAYGQVLLKRISSTDTTEATKKVVESVTKVEKMVNGARNPDENPRGLTGLVEDLAERIKRHETDDEKRHEENQDIAHKHKDAIDGLRRDLSGGRPK